MKKLSAKKCVSAIVAVSLMLVVTSTASASTIRKQLDAYYTGLKIQVNGQVIVPKDERGNTVQPFAVDGTNYLPIRAVGNALGLDVAWDGNTNTAILTSKETVSAGNTHDLATYHYLFVLGEQQDEMLKKMDFMVDTMLYHKENVYEWKKSCDASFDDTQSYLETMIDYCETDEQYEVFQLFLDAQGAYVDAWTALWDYYYSGSNQKFSTYLDKYSAAKTRVYLAKNYADDAFSAALAK